MSTTLARFSTYRRIRLHHESVYLYNALRDRYRAAWGTPEEARLLRLMTRAMERELRRALPIFS